MGKNKLSHERLTITLVYIFTEITKIKIAISIELDLSKKEKINPLTRVYFYLNRDYIFG